MNHCVRCGRPCLNRNNVTCVACQTAVSLARLRQICAERGADEDRTVAVLKGV